MDALVSGSPTHLQSMASETLVTPAGEVLFANVLKPKLVKNESGDKLQYGIVLLQADPEQDPIAKRFIGSLHKAFMEKYGGNAKYGPNGKKWKRETLTNEEGIEVPTGLVRITFSRDTATSRGIELPPPMVQDAKGNPWPVGVAIGNGSVCKIAYSIWPWDHPVGGKGLTLQLLGVRVLDHVPYVMQAVDPGVFGAPEEGTDATALTPAAAADPFGLDAIEGPASTEEVPW
ncbi:hypothetical protein LBMAG41_13400 [Cyanobium sp.]|nr:hypothetical protein LBMAG41_13400 [Cyanobium sp.]